MLATNHETDLINSGLENMHLDHETSPGVSVQGQGTPVGVRLTASRRRAAGRQPRGAWGTLGVEGHPGQ